jgi:hypothetical protein
MVEPDSDQRSQGATISAIAVDPNSANKIKPQ